MEQHKLYTFKIKGWNDSVLGLLESIGNEWLLIKRIGDDFRYDGYGLIRRKYVQCSILDTDSSFKEDVLSVVGIMDIKLPHIPLETISGPFNWIKESNMTVELYPKDDSIMFVGKMLTLLKSSFLLSTIDEKARWDSEPYRIKMNEIVSICVDTDYVSSLLTYSQSTEQEFENSDSLKISKLYDFTIKGWDALFCGIVENVGKEWILVKHITGDYQYDGVALIQRRFIKSAIRNEDVLFKEQILLAKWMMEYRTPIIPLDNLMEPINWIMKQEIVVSFCPKKESIIYVGRIIKVLSNSFVLKSMTNRAIWDSIPYKLLMSKIVAICIDTVYVNSLLAYRELKDS